MARPRRNPFYLLLGVVGFLFTLTAANYGFAVLRGVKHAAAGDETPPHVLQTLMDRHGTSILIGELLVLAVATFGAVAVDHADGERIRRETRAGRERAGE